MSESRGQTGGRPLADAGSIRGGDRSGWLALRALERSLGESPRFAPSIEQVHATLLGAHELLEREGFRPTCFLPRANAPAGLSLLEALGRANVKGACHIHCRRYLTALCPEVTLVAWEQGRTLREALALLGRAARLLRCDHRGGWTVGGPVDAAGVLRVRRELAARAGRSLGPESPQLELSLEEP